MQLAVSRSAQRGKYLPPSAQKYDTKLTPKALHIARHSLNNLFSPAAASSSHNERASAPVSPKALFRNNERPEFEPKGYDHLSDRHATAAPASSAIFTSQSVAVDIDQLLNPIPKSKGVVQCKLRRSKKSKEITLYIQTGKDRFSFMMSARKKRMPGPARFTISSRTPEFHKDTNSHVGRLEGDLFKEKYNLFEAPKPSKPKLQLGCIFFEVSEDCPRKSTIIIPEVSIDCNCTYGFSDCDD